MSRDLKKALARSQQGLKTRNMIHPRSLPWSRSHRICRYAWVTEKCGAGIISRCYFLHNWWWLWNITRYTSYVNPLPDRGAGATPPPPLRFFADSEKMAAPPGFGVPYGANLAQLLVKKNWPGQVRSRSYHVIRGTTSGDFTTKSVFYRTLTWRHWCKW